MRFVLLMLNILFERGANGNSSMKTKFCLSPPKFNTSQYLQELNKLRRKVTTTVQVLTHLKEKLQFVQVENQVEKARLREVEETVARVFIVICLRTFVFLNIICLLRRLRDAEAQ